ncbi:hypothetical protein L3X38_027872 [Prunus dulcis]|uniref:Uncharacterized protein n=1 Tax=Prunus dulcis TaxID=3755 RepID=A0AAD4VNR0_PRUDU|nr:hypothetical protein L3X38_027872 [Prunus dulcis]
MRIATREKLGYLTRAIPKTYQKLDLDNMFAYVRKDAQERMSLNGANDTQEASVMVAYRKKRAT